MYVCIYVCVCVCVCVCTSVILRIPCASLLIRILMFRALGTLEYRIDIGKLKNVVPWDVLLLLRSNRYLYNIHLLCRGGSTILEYAAALSY